MLHGRQEIVTIIQLTLTIKLFLAMMKYLAINNEIRDFMKITYRYRGKTAVCCGCWIGDGKKKDFWTDFIQINFCGLLPVCHTLVLKCFIQLIPGIS